MGKIEILSFFPSKGGGGGGGGSDVMVTSFIVKEGSETIRHLGSDSLIDELYSILHKTRIN